MASIARIRLAGATADDHDRLDQEVATRLETMGGPRDGLMVHLGYEEGDDLVLVEAWRTEDLFESHYRDLLQPALGRPISERPSPRSALPCRSHGRSRSRVTEAADRTLATQPRSRTVLSQFASVG